MEKSKHDGEIDPEGTALMQKTLRLREGIEALKELVEKFESELAIATSPEEKERLSSAIGRYQESIRINEEELAQSNIDRISHPSFDSEI